MKTVRFLLALVAIGAALECRAQLVAYDNFSGYSAGYINGQGHGYGWTDNWGSRDSPFYAEPGNDLAYSGLTGATGRVYAAYSSGASISRHFSEVSSGTVYFGAVVQYWAGNYAIRFVEFSNGTSGMRLGQFTGSGGESSTQWLDLMPVGGGLVGTNTGIAVTDQPTYLVGKIEFNTSGSLDSVRLWVNPTGASDLQNNANASASSLNLYDIGSVNTFSYYLNTWNPGSPGGYFDEIRVSTSADLMFGAIPEPAAYAVFVGLAGLAWALRRRLLR